MDEIPEYGIKNIRQGNEDLHEKVKRRTREMAEFFGEEEGKLGYLRLPRGRGRAVRTTLAESDSVEVGMTIFGSSSGEIEHVIEYCFPPEALEGNKKELKKDLTDIEGIEGTSLTFTSGAISVSTSALLNEGLEKKQKVESRIERYLKSFE